MLPIIHWLNDTFGEPTKPIQLLPYDDGCDRLKYYSRQDPLDNMFNWKTTITIERSLRDTCAGRRGDYKFYLDYDGTTIIRKENFCEGRELYGDKANNDNL